MSEATPATFVVDPATVIDHAAKPTATPAPAPAPAAAAIDDNTVTLETPIVRSGQTITQFTLRKPLGSDLRGLSLVEVSHMNQDAMEVLLPRISDPMITNAEVRRMDIADLLSAGTVLTGFLLPRAMATASANS